MTLTLCDEKYVKIEQRQLEKTHIEYDSLCYHLCVQPLTELILSLNHRCLVSQSIQVAFLVL
jgi:hypothetical protein